jgi:hypothetical protein
MLLNQHNPLFKTTTIEPQKLKIITDRNEEVRKELIFSPQD